MKPKGVLTDKDYHGLASELVDYHDPENFLDNCEREYQASNRNFYKHLEKAVSSLIIPESLIKESGLVIIPPPVNAKVEKIANLVKQRIKKSNMEDFDISKLQFELRNRISKPQPQAGKILHLVCCEDTIYYLTGLVPFAPNREDFSIFEHFFSEPHKTKMFGATLQLIVQKPDKLDLLLNSIRHTAKALSRAELKEYFFECVENDLKIAQNREDMGRFRFPKMQFIERLESVKGEVLNNPEAKNSMPEHDEKFKGSTSARQVLAIHYLLKYSKVEGIDQTKKAEFIVFLTGKNNKNIYDLVRNPLATKQGKFRRADLQFIRTYFENLGLEEIVKMINNELSTHG